MKKPKRDEETCCPIQKAVTCCTATCKKRFPQLKAAKLPAKRTHRLKLFDIAHELPSVLA